MLGLRLCGEHEFEVREATGSLFGRTAFDREHAGVSSVSQYGSDATPVNDSIAAGAANGSACDFAFLGFGHAEADVFRVDVDQQ
jgi:hypothetical protein